MLISPTGRYFGLVKLRLKTEGAIHRMTLAPTPCDSGVTSLVQTWGRQLAPLRLFIKDIRAHLIQN